MIVSLLGQGPSPDARDFTNVGRIAYKVGPQERSCGDILQGLDKLRIVTTSWDDSDHADLKVAEVLRCREIRGTFYVPIKYRERPVAHSDLRALASEAFEIGAHGWFHKHLWCLQPEELGQEVRPCKGALEDILGKQVEIFYYPRGRYDANSIRASQPAGYGGARTVRMLATRPTFNPL